MLRKGLAVFLLFAFAVAMLAACEPASGPADDSSAS